MSEYNNLSIGQIMSAATANFNQTVRNRPRQGNKRRPRCPTGEKRPKSANRGRILEIVEKNFVSENRPTLVREVMAFLAISRARANEIIQVMAKDKEIILLSTGTKGQAQQILPLNALTPNPFLSGGYNHGKTVLKEFPDELLIQRYCEVLIEICKRKRITNAQIIEYGMRYAISPKKKDEQ